MKFQPSKMIQSLFLILCSILLSCEAEIDAQSGTGNVPVPVVIWHGMGDNCCNPWSMGFIKEFIEKHVPGVYVHSLEIGSSVVQDTENGFFMDVNEQIDLVCQKIQNDTRLSNG